MNTVCFDAFTLGNHRFDSADTGLVKFIDYLRAAAARRRCCRLTSARRPVRCSPPASPTTIIQRSGQQIGVIGLTVKDKTQFASRPDVTTAFLGKPPPPRPPSTPCARG